MDPSISSAGGNGIASSSTAPTTSSATDNTEAQAAALPTEQSSLAKKVDVSHFPHYGLKRGMACTFCRRRKLRCSGDRPLCTNCVKYTKVCEYGPPVKDSKRSSSARTDRPLTGFEAQPMHHSVPVPGQPSMVLLDHQMQQQMGQMPHHLLYSTQPLPQQPLLQQSLPQQPGGFDYMSSMYSDSPMVDAVPGETLSYQSTTYTDFQQPTGSLPGHLTAQPTVGMPPYVRTPDGFQQHFPNNTPPPQAQQQVPQQWVPTPSPQVSQASYNMSQQSSMMEIQTPPVSRNSISGAYMMDQYTTEPLFDQHLNAGGMSELQSGSTSHLTSGPSTPDDPRAPNGSKNRATSTNSNTPSSTATTSRPLASSMYRHSPSLHYVADVTVVEGITERLGEFLFSPNASAVKEEETFKRRRGHSGKPTGPMSPSSVMRMRTEHDGLMDASRSLLLDCFLAHCTLFFEMSVPRFRYRMTFMDRRRPSLALLNAMYLWATRISNSPQMSNMEKHFFEQACKHLDLSTSTVDRLIDAVRAAMLLSAYSHSSGRHHEGWCLAGVAIRLVLSCGLHRIKSCVHQPEKANNPFLRNRVFLLPPPEDAVELGERIHAFWAVFAIDRCGSVATGYPAGIRDEEITTPFGRHLVDISSGAVSEADDLTVRDLYSGSAVATEHDTPYTKWVKCVAILERASKLCFLEPAEDSPYARAWNQYTLTLHHDPNQAPPDETLNQAKYRNPRDYRECLLAIEQLVGAIGSEGVFPVHRRMHAEQDGTPEPVIPTNIVMLHHLIAAVHMMLHDVNSLDVENTEAVKAARKSVLLFRAMPQIPFTDVDAFVVLVWSLIAKVLIKETHRLVLLGDLEGAHAASSDADTIIEEMNRIGQTMYLARTQAKAVEELKHAALAAGQPGESAVVVPQLESFMFPQQM